MPGRAGPNQRLHTEARPENRTEAERDHDRVLYTTAFQRLAGVTQIAAPESGLAMHNRLTHTLKVAQVARRLAKRLGLATDRQEVAAAAALAHDLGTRRSDISQRQPSIRRRGHGVGSRGTLSRFGS